ncbi:hypothetical protein WJX72_012185 [[Myrmecia] bisecta]|uniref:Intraflagellar transport protein 140 n=1 Tax=[Myrmecia] bisecta TaxID=41462 RepID=A0AAW1QT17_9CHLO
MSVYIINSVSTRTALAAWSKAPEHAPLLAVAADDGSVGIHGQAGDLHVTPDFAGWIKNVRSTEGVASLAWHPSLMLLTIGWKDGGLSLWSAGDGRLREDSKTHRAAISCLEWQSPGALLASGDACGRLGLWKVDSQMRPMSLVSYAGEANEAMSHVLFGTSTGAVLVYFATATATGTTVFSADDQGHKVRLYTVDSQLAHLFMYQAKQQLVGVCTASQLYVHGCEDDGKWEVIVKMKLAAGSGEGTASLQVAWAGKHTLASASDRDVVVRMYNLKTEDNFVLHTDAPGTPATSKVASLSYSHQSSTLAAATSSGRVVMWRHLGEPAGPAHGVAADPASSWQALQSVTVPGQPVGIAWGASSRLLGVVCSDAIHACERVALQRRQHGNLCAAQTGAKQVAVTSATGSNGRTAAPSFQVRGLGLNADHLLLWSGKTAAVYIIGPTQLLLHASFTCQATSMAIYHEVLFCVDGHSAKVEVRGLDGALQQTHALEAAEGLPAKVDAAGDHLAVLTTLNCLRLWRLEPGKEAKPYGGSRWPQIGEAVVESVRCNCNGAKVSILAGSQAGGDQQQLFVYEVESDRTTSYPFAAESRNPQSHCWDLQHPMLLACETVPLPSRSGMPPSALVASTSGRTGDAPATTAAEVATLFAAPQDGLLLHDYQPLATGQGLVGIAAPYLSAVRAAAPDSNGPSTSDRGAVVERISMRSFAGMERGDESTRKALLDFSYQMCTGNMDQAYKAVKIIRNATLWENMAHTAIKTKRLDVVLFCLGNMESHKAAQAIREARGVVEPDARLGTIAVHLGMAAEAEELFSGCGRFDLLNELHQATGHWSQALDVAMQHDRIHLRTTHYRYAQELEAAGNFQGSMAHYEKADAHRVEVPRLLYDAQRLDELRDYIMRSADKDLLKWWARYCESISDFASALSSYQAAGDPLACVRLHCHQGNFREAADIVDQSGSAAAAFHLARQFEATGEEERVADAVRYFAKSQRSSHGARLAKRHGMDNELFNLALQSSQNMVLETAEHFENNGQLEKAVLLYQKAGRTRRALDLCFAAQLFDALHSIAEELTAESDPKLLMRCGEFFLEHGQFDKAVKLLVNAKQHVRALDLCTQHGVTITEDMAEAMTPEKTARNAEEREALLRRIAGTLEEQGNFHLACKKFTQAGDRTRAMAALIKSGDTDKIIFFAGVSRQPETYTMAANYLQTLDWHTRPDFMKHIVTFYTKARVLDSLSAFYEACAQIEIDEYRDYGKALQAMHEALRCLGKSRAADRDLRMASLSRRIASTERFLSARELLASDPGSAIRTCETLVVEASGQANPHEAGIRVGDVYALLIEYWVGQGGLQQAYQVIEKMRQRGIPLGPYIAQETVDQIYQAVGASQPRAEAGRPGERRPQHEDSEDSFIEEDAMGFSDDDERRF